MRLMVLVAALAAVATPVAAGDWRIGSIEARGAVLIDVANIRQLGTTTKVAWSAIARSSNDDSGAAYYLTRDEYDCQQETITNTSFMTFSLEGRSLATSHERQATEFIAPGTANERILRDVCRGTFRPKSWNDPSTFVREFRSTSFQQY